MKVVSNEEAEEADFVVCVRSDQATPFTDNLHSPCSECGVSVQYRPHAPKKPKRICMECAVGLLEDEDLEDSIITTETQQEAIKEIKKQREH